MSKHSLNKFKLGFCLFLDIPAAVSLPHFLDADPTLLENIEGLEPNREKHGSYVILQPVSIYSTIYEIVNCYINNNINKKYYLNALSYLKIDQIKLNFIIEINYTFKTFFKKKDITWKNLIQTICNNAVDIKN